MADNTQLRAAIATEFEVFLSEVASRARVYDFAEHLIRALTERGWRIERDTTEHIIEFRADGWTIKHPLACRPWLFDCPVNRAAEHDLTEPPDVLGRFACSANDLADRLLIGDRIEEADGG